MDSEIIGAIIGPFLTTLLAGGAYIFQSWQKTRRWEDQQERSLAKAVQEVQFIDTWLSALDRIGDHDPEHAAKVARATKDLERSYQVLAADLGDDGPRPRVKGPGDILGAIFMVPLQSLPAKILRVFYWLMLVIGLSWSLLIIGVSSEGQVSLATVVGVSILLTVIGLIPAGILGVLTKVIDRSGQPTPAARPVPLSPPPDGTMVPGPFVPYAGPYQGPNPGPGPFPPGYRGTPR